MRMSCVCVLLYSFHALPSQVPGRRGGQTEVAEGSLVGQLASERHGHSFWGKQ